MEITGSPFYLTTIKPRTPRMTDLLTPDRQPERPLGAALKRGLRLRCPACGEGQLLHSYLKVNATCPACGEELFHHRADDGPAYLTILIVGHLMAPAMLYAFTTWRPEPITLFATLGLGVVALSLFLLPRMKGAMVAIQWANRMHGFAARQ